MLTRPPGGCRRQRCLRNILDSGVNDMIVAEEVVNICSGNFTGGNGADNGRWAGYGVAACKRLGAAFYDAVRQGREALTVDRDAGGSKCFGVDALTNGDDDNVARDDIFFLGGLDRRGLPSLPTGPMCCGCVMRAVTLPSSSCSMRSGACSGKMVTPSAAASAISSDRAVISSTRRR